MSKIIIAVAILGTTFNAFAGPRGCGGRGHRPPPSPHYHCHGDWWGRGGCNFWPGFVGGVVGGMTYSALARPYCRETVVVQPPPTVVTQPVVVQQPTVVTQPVVVQQPAVVQQAVPTMVWVPGQYVDQVQANGSTVRVWNPGHYEQQ